MKALDKNNETTGYKGYTLSKFQVLQSPPRINIQSLHKTIPLHCHHHWLTDQQSLEVQNSALPEVKHMHARTHTRMHAHTHTFIHMHAYTIHTDKKLPEVYDQLFVETHQIHHWTRQLSVTHGHQLASFVLPKIYNTSHEIYYPTQ